MIVIDGYAIEEYPKQNKILIGLPQTMDNITSTNIPIGSRRKKLDDEELAMVLAIVRQLYTKAGDQGE